MIDKKQFLMYLDKWKFFAYLCRWQLSTPVLWGVLYFLGNGFWGTVVANFIGGCIFFFVDRKIFNNNKKVEETEKL